MVSLPSSLHGALKSGADGVGAAAVSRNQLSKEYKGIPEDISVDLCTLWRVQ